MKNVNRKSPALLTLSLTLYCVSTISSPLWAGGGGGFTQPDEDNDPYTASWGASTWMGDQSSNESELASAADVHPFCHVFTVRAEIVSAGKSYYQFGVATPGRLKGELVFLTPAHVVHGAEKLELSCRDRNTTAVVLASTTALDLAILRPQKPESEILLEGQEPMLGELTKLKTPVPADWSMSFINERQSDEAYFSGFIYTRHEKGFQASSSEFELSKMQLAGIDLYVYFANHFSIVPGMSGSILTDSHSRPLAMLTRTETNGSKSMGVPLELVAGWAELGLAQLGKKYSIDYLFRTNSQNELERYRRLTWKDGDGESWVEELCPAGKYQQSAALQDSGGGAWGDGGGALAPRLNFSGFPKWGPANQGFFRNFEACSYEGLRTKSGEQVLALRKVKNNELMRLASVEDLIPLLKEYKYSLAAMEERFLLVHDVDANNLRPICDSFAAEAGGRRFNVRPYFGRGRNVPLPGPFKNLDLNQRTEFADFRADLALRGLFDSNRGLYCKNGKLHLSQLSEHQPLVVIDEQRVGVGSSFTGDDYWYFDIEIGARIKGTLVILEDENRKLVIEIDVPRTSFWQHRIETEQGELWFDLDTHDRVMHMAFVPSSENGQVKPKYWMHFRSWKIHESIFED